MKSTILLLLVTAWTLNTAYARKGLFGKNESINRIQELEVKGPSGEELYLAHKTTSQFFIAGLYFKDDGYVLGIKGSYGSYYPLTDDQISKMQEVGQLPNPLPKYDIPWTDYAFGYSGWILIPLLVWRGIASLNRTSNAKN